VQPSTGGALDVERVELVLGKQDRHADGDRRVLEVAKLT
jgi:hypothetical protein